MVLAILNPIVKKSGFRMIPVPNGQISDPHCKSLFKSTCVSTHGLEECAGFFVSSIKPDIFFRKRLCIRFSSMSRSLRPEGALGLAVIKTSFAILFLGQIGSH